MGRATGMMPGEDRGGGSGQTGADTPRPPHLYVSTIRKVRPGLDVPIASRIEPALVHMSSGHIFRTALVLLRQRRVQHHGSQIIDKT